MNLPIIASELGIRSPDFRSLALALTTKLHGSNNISMDCRDAWMVWTQHGWTVESNRSVSCGPCHPHWEVWQVFTVGTVIPQWELIGYQGQVSAQTGEPVSKGEFGEGMLHLHQQRAGVSLGIKQKK